MLRTPEPVRRHRLVAASIACMLAGCIASDVVICPGTGVVCPVGAVCSPDGSRCLGLEQPTCGDGYLLPLGANGVPDDPSGPAEEQDDEICDDGNRVGGDGCSANCKSTEVCGNGIHDVFEFGGQLISVEDCDDGNELELDGCTAACNEVRGMWQPYEDGPSAREFHAMAYDAARGRTVLFGGLDDRNQNDTWEWNGRVWTNVSPPDGSDSPSPRRTHTMAYDVARGRVVLFGGTDSYTRNDTWEWDGSIWTEVTPESAADSPPALRLHAMTYDAARERVVLFGGLGESNNGDTWEWDGSIWTNVTPADTDDSPSARYGHAMTYDAARGRVVLFGGDDGSNRGDTWEWDGSTWTDVTPSDPNDSPDPRKRHAMAYDAASERVVLFGGTDGSRMGDTWEWDGAAWTLADSIDSPPTLERHAMAYDTAHRRVVLFGGISSSMRDETWEWGDAGWTEVSPAPLPSVDLRFNHAMTFDAARGRVVLFAGYDLSSGPRDTWEWDGDIWTEVSPAASEDSPPALNSHAIGYDAARARVVLFGGSTPGVPGDYHDETWAWDGNVWTNVTPGAPESSPSARHNHAMAYDATRERLVLFGGTGATTNLGDTWEWDGSVWTDVTPADADDSPSARNGHALAYDAAHGVVVLFGGSDASKNRDDTWIWDGTVWTEMTPTLAADSPSARADHSMTYDAALGRVVLYGGRDSAPRNDTWEWDGRVWANVLPIASDNFPAERSNHAMSYDAARGRTVLHGGAPGHRDTWRFSHRATGPKQCHSGLDGDSDGLIGCDDPDCWGYCTPHCPPYSTPMWPTDCDLSRPHCGDGVCNEYLESARLCPDDGCDPVVVACGDFHCDPGETQAICPGDCTE